MRAATSRRSGAVRFAATVGAARCPLPAQVDPHELELDPVRARAGRRGLRAGRSRSQARTGAEPELRGGDREHPRAGAPDRRAARAPRPASASSSSSSRHIRVVGWAPVPNAWPGSTTTSIVPVLRLRPRTGRTQRRSADQRPARWKSCQRSAQSSGISVDVTSTSPSAGRRLEVGERGQLARRAVDRVLDPAVALAPPRPRRAPARRARRAPARRAPGGSEPRGGSTAAPAAAAPKRERPSRRPARRPERLVELLGELALLLVELGRDEDVEDHVLVAPRPRRGATAAPGRAGSPARRAGRRPGPRPRARRRASATVDRAAEHRPGRGHLDDRDQVLAVALEALVLGDHDLDVEVARPAPGLAGVARRPRSGSAGRTRSRPGRRPPRCASRTIRPSPPHSSQGCLRDLCPAPPQVGQAPVRTSWPKAVRRTSRSSPAPPHVSQVRIGVPGSAPLPRQRSQVETASNETSRLAPVSTSSS